MSVLDYLDRPIAFHRVFVTITESVTAALFLSQAIYWAKRTSNSERWFYKTREQWEEETGLERRQQESARKVLRHLGLLEEKLCGVPAKLHYRVNAEVLERKLARQQVGTKAPNCVGGNSPTNTETTQRLQEQDTPSAGDDELGLSPETKTSRAAVRRLFSKYLDGTDRSPRMYTLTPKRMTCGLARLEDCRKMCGDLEKAEAMMGLAIEAMLQSKFHMGDNDQKKQYTDWIDNLFKNTEKLEWWLARYEEK